MDIVDISRHDDLHPRLQRRGAGQHDEVCPAQPRPELLLDWVEPGQGELYCTVLYCTILYYTVLYCTVLYLARASSSPVFTSQSLPGGNLDT